MKLVRYLFIALLLIVGSFCAVYWQNDIPLADLKATYAPSPSKFVQVNDVLVHISNPNLPFGGVQSSGTGSCHGFYGFKAFSHERSVMYQSAVDFNWMVYPPYNMSLLKLLKRIF